MNDNQKAAYADQIKSAVQNLKPIGNYASDFAAECQADRARISTGIHGFDVALNGGLANELYIMGAETSTGKSAFLMSIAQHIAQSGIDVLYFALEMGRSEFVARGISSISFERHLADQSCRTVKAADVLYWDYDRTLHDFVRVPYSLYSDYAAEYFRRYGEHLYILEAGLNGYTVRDIANTAAIFQREAKKPVCVFIDYLQLIKADPEDRSQSDRKTKTDVCVTTLKALASQVGMPVFTISSVGRTSYNGKIGLASMKESGDTEYTGGVMLGWNWTGVTDTDKEEDREAEKQACRDRGYRRMSLEVLKYRNSERDNSINLSYYPAYSYFAGPDEDGFIPISEDETPFGGKKQSQKRVIEG